MIEISTDGSNFVVKSSLDRRYETVSLTSFEYPVVNSVLEIIYKKIDPSFIHLERRTDNYISIVAFGCDDFCRIKIGPKSQWISLSLGKDHQKQYANDPIFDEQKNKKQIHWKIPLNKEMSIGDISVYIEKAAENSIKNNK
ncbi:MAG: hypothetical protein ACLUVV_05460 [Christensenellales bacterium]